MPDLADDYVYLSTIGEGSYGYVWQCQERATGRIVAIKAFKQAHTDPTVRDLALREIRTLKALQHPAIIPLINAFRSKSGRVYMVFPYMSHSAFHALDEYPAGLPAPQLKLLTWQLLQALACMHAKKVVHRDIKPANILLSETGEVKLCDFGFARPVGCTERGAEAMSPYVVTRWYRPPEVLVGAEYGPAADIWSLGCTVAELATGRPLFQGSSTADQLWRILRCFRQLPPAQASRVASDPSLSGVLSAPLDGGRSLQERMVGCDHALIRLVEACLRPDPDRRCTAAELLQYPYFWSVPRMIMGTELEGLYGGTTSTPTLAAAPRAAQGDVGLNCRGRTTAAAAIAARRQHAPAAASEGVGAVSDAPSSTQTLPAVATSRERDASGGQLALSGRADQLFEDDTAYGRQAHHSGSDALERRDPWPRATHSPGTSASVRASRPACEPQEACLQPHHGDQESEGGGGRLPSRAPPLPRSTHARLHPPEALEQELRQGLEQAKRQQQQQQERQQQEQQERQHGQLRANVGRGSTALPMQQQQLLLLAVCGSESPGPLPSGVGGSSPTGPGSTAPSDGALGSGSGSREGAPCASATHGLGPPRVQSAFTPASDTVPQSWKRASDPPPELERFAAPCFSDPNLWLTGPAGNAAGHGVAMEQQREREREREWEREAEARKRECEQERGPEQEEPLLPLILIATSCASGAAHTGTGTITPAITGSLQHCSTPGFAPQGGALCAAVARYRAGLPAPLPDGVVAAAATGSGAAPVAAAGTNAGAPQPYSLVVTGMSNASGALVSEVGALQVPTHGSVQCAPGQGTASGGAAAPLLLWLQRQRSSPLLQRLPLLRRALTNGQDQPCTGVGAGTAIAVGGMLSYGGGYGAAGTPSAAVAWSLSCDAVRRAALSSVAYSTAAGGVGENHAALLHAPPEAHGSTSHLQTVPDGGSMWGLKRQQEVQSQAQRWMLGRGKCEDGAAAASVAAGRRVAVGTTPVQGAGSSAAAAVINSNNTAGVAGAFSVRALGGCNDGAPSTCLHAASEAAHAPHCVDSAAAAAPAIRPWVAVGFSSGSAPDVEEITAAAAVADRLGVDARPVVSERRTGLAAALLSASSGRNNFLAAGSGSDGSGGARALAAKASSQRTRFFASSTASVSEPCEVSFFVPAAEPEGGSGVDVMAICTASSSAKEQAPGGGARDAAATHGSAGIPARVCGAAAFVTVDGEAAGKGECKGGKRQGAFWRLVRAVKRVKEQLRGRSPQ